MNTTIRFYVRSAYGVSRCYLADPVQAATVATLTRRKTVERADLTALQCLGCSVEQIADPSGMPFAPPPTPEVAIAAALRLAEKAIDLNDTLSPAERESAEIDAVQAIRANLATLGHSRA